MDYKPLKSQKILSALTRLIACLDVYGHTTFAEKAICWKSQYLTGSKSLKQIKALLEPIIMVVISELAFDMRQCYTRNNMVSASGYAQHIKVITSLL